GNVIVLDTASTTAVVEDRMLKIKSIRWDDATTANHKAVLKDKHGNIIWQSTAAGADNEDAEIVEEWYEGLIMHTLGSGTIVVRLM
ncbi:MAG: hypothetical protein ACE5DX_05635, partial [Candidatus Dojkabacteria bacterium]